MGFGRLPGGDATKGAGNFSRPGGDAIQGKPKFGGATGGVMAGKGTYSGQPQMTTKPKPVSGGAVRGVGTFRKV